MWLYRILMGKPGGKGTLPKPWKNKLRTHGARNQRQPYSD
jgi:hypothetical protein